MFYHQKVARVRVFADIQNFALRAHCVHGIPKEPAQFGVPPWWFQYGPPVTELATLAGLDNLVLHQCQ